MSALHGGGEPALGSSAAPTAMALWQGPGATAGPGVAEGAGGYDRDPCGRVVRQIGGTFDSSVNTGAMTLPGTNEWGWPSR